jgi:hypothetical protein
MKHLLSILLLSFICGNIFAQKKDNRSTLRIRLSDDAPLTVSVNGRYFQKTGKSITIGDLPRKKHQIKVYRFRPYKDGQGGKAELVYSGRIKTESGNIYDCVVDVPSRKLRMKQVAALEPTVQARYVQEQPAMAPIASPKARSAALTQLKAKIDAQNEDAEKLKIANKHMAASKAMVDEVKDIATWFYFDDTRLAFIKSCFGRVNDPENFTSLGSVFTLESTYSDFQKFLQQKQ